MHHINVGRIGVSLQIIVGECNPTIPKKLSDSIKSSEHYLSELKIELQNQSNRFKKEKS